MNISNTGYIYVGSTRYDNWQSYLDNNTDRATINLKISEIKEKLTKMENPEFAWREDEEAVFVSAINVMQYILDNPEKFPSRKNADDEKVTDINLSRVLITGENVKALGKLVGLLPRQLEGFPSEGHKKTLEAVEAYVCKYRSDENRGLVGQLTQLRGTANTAAASPAQNGEANYEEEIKFQEE